MNKLNSKRETFKTHFLEERNPKEGVSGKRKQLFQGGASRKTEGVCGMMKRGAKGLVKSRLDKSFDKKWNINLLKLEKLSC